MERNPRTYRKVPLNNSASVSYAGAGAGGQRRGLRIWLRVRCWGLGISLVVRVGIMYNIKQRHKINKVQLGIGVRNGFRG